MSKTKKLLRELYTDERAAHWTATLLQKHAVPGLILAPKAPIDDANLEDIQEVQNRLDRDFTGSNRGRSMVLKGPTEVTQYGFSPEQMKLGEIRDIPEERVSATLGIPAAVVGFGSGLQSTKVGATMAELVDLAWQNGVLPRMRLVAAELTEQLLPDFGETSQDVEIVFDTSQVPIMADYHTKLAGMHEILVKSGVEMRSQAKRALGLPTSPDDDVYVIQAGIELVRPDGSPAFEKPERAPALATPEPRLSLVSGKADAIERKPIGPFPDFAACVAHMQAEEGGGHSEESARRICGTMEREMSGLTPRQVEVAKLLAAGTLHKNIAAALGVSERTAERDIAAVRQRAG